MASSDKRDGGTLAGLLRSTRLGSTRQIVIHATFADNFSGGLIAPALSRGNGAA
jgi:hypothetical protein